MENICYVYRHRRLDTNEIFYVGIGTVYNQHKNSLTYSTYYRRAFSKKRANDIWSKIVLKTGYSVEIVADNLTKSDSEELEKFLIELYGRINLNTGVLSNLTDGGERNSGAKRSQEYKDNMRKVLTGKLLGELNPFYGKKHSEETKASMVKNHADFSGGNHPRAKKVINTSTNEVYDCAKDVAEKFNITYKVLTSKLSGARRNTTNFRYL